jgi:hypothetical protein
MAKKKSRATTRGAAAARASDHLAARLAEIEASIDALNRTIERLEAVPIEEVKALALADRQARAHAMSDAFLAIEDLENAKLQALNAAFEAQRPKLQQATADLGRDLGQLTDAVEFIRAAASAVGIIADIAKVIPRL